jgi:hypothetical protein
MKKAMKCQALACAVVLWCALPAHAAKYDGYVCGVSYAPYASTTYGQHGYVFLSVNSDPGCAGTPLHSVTYCSTGASSAICAPLYLYGESPLLTLYQALVAAVQHNTRVLAVTDATCGQPASCGTVVEFHATP